VSEQKDWIHDQVAELLSAYIDGEVTAAERELVEAHLASCDVCGRDLATLRQTVALLGQLPQVAAPRPFTLRESDVESLRLVLRPARLTWWQSGWLRGAVAAVAMLLCVAVAGGVLLLQRGAGFGASGEPAHVALQPQAQPLAATQAAESSPGARGEVGKQADNFAPVPTAPAQPPREAAAEAPVPPTATAAPAAKAARAETPPQPTASPAAAAALAQPPAPLGTPTPLATPLPAPLAPASPSGPARSYGSPSPTASPEASLEMAPRALDQATSGAGAVTSPTATPEPQVVATMLWEVQDLSLVVEPGVITASGRLPVGRGLRLAAQLLRDGQPTDWTMAATQTTVTGVNGRFSLSLQASAGAPDFDLFAVAPATYTIRVYPAVPLEGQPGEAHITFDTYQPPAGEPAATLPAPPTSTPAPARSSAPTSPAGAAPTAPHAAAAMPASRRRGSMASLLTLCGTGLAALFGAGLAAFYSLWIGPDRRQ
jgi:hypothetical protein